MKGQKFNPIILILVVLFIIGMLLASNYSPATRELASICIEEDTQPKKLTKILTEINGVKTVFLDDKSNLITFRYNTDKLNLEDIKGDFRKNGVEISEIYSVNPLKKKKRKKSLKQNEDIFKVELSPSIQ